METAKPPSYSDPLEDEESEINSYSAPLEDESENGIEDYSLMSDREPADKLASLGKRTLSTSSTDNDVYNKRARDLDLTAVEHPDGLAVKLNEPSYTRMKLPVDPWCDPNNPRTIQFQDISAAQYKIRKGIIETVCSRSNLLSIMLKSDIYFKKDFLQVTGSFKERGARYTLLQLTEEQKKKGVIAASAGNHALALSYHGQMLNIPVTVVMPVVAPLMKISLCKQNGANVIVHGNDLGESKELCMKLVEEQGLMYINGYDHPNIIAGQGTMGIEIVSQVENVDAVIVPVGGGGLIAGVGLAVKYLCPSAKVYGVEAEKCASFTAALAAGKPTYTKPGSTTADGLSVPVVGVNSFHIAKKIIDKMATVSEEFISLAILRLIEIEKAVVEGAGAIGLAALLEGKFPELVGKRVVIPLCGGNIDTTVLGRCIERGLVVDRRLIRFSVTVSDRPGGIAELAILLSQVGASIKDIYHERAWVKTDIFSVRVKVVVETRDNEHANELEKALEAHYHDVLFNPVM